MAFALTKVRAYGVESEEAVNKRYKQVLILSYTGLNSNVAVDIGNYTGTFWTAVGGTEPGTTALAAVKDIQRRALSFYKAGGTALANKVQMDASDRTFLSLDCTASSGGGATETIACPGILTTDTILGVTQQTKGANSTALIGYPSVAAGADSLGTAVWTADPGASAVLRVAISRIVASTPTAGQYLLAMNATNTQIPDITFLSGEAPTSADIIYEWVLKDAEEPVSVYKSA